MKKVKILKYISIVFLFTFLFNIFSVYAFGNDLKVYIKNKSENMEEIDLKLDKNEIKGEIVFSELGDYVTFGVSIVNNESDEYRISFIDENNKWENIDISYEYNTDYVPKNGNFEFEIKLLYGKELKGFESVNIDDLTIIVHLEKENGEESQIPINNSDNKSDNNLFIYVAVIVVVLLVLCILFVKVKRKNKIIVFILMIFVCSQVKAISGKDVSFNIIFKNIIISNNDLEKHDTGNKSINDNTDTTDEIDDNTKENNQANTKSNNDISNNNTSNNNTSNNTSNNNAGNNNNSNNNANNNNNSNDNTTSNNNSNDNTTSNNNSNDNTVNDNTSNNEVITTYKVKHYYGYGNNIIFENVEVFEAVVGESVTPNLIERDGFTNPDKKTIIVSENGNNEVIYVYNKFEENIFVSYNGKLTIENMGLVNRYGEKIQLTGMSIANSINLVEEYYNRESLTALKEWGVNVVRIPMDVIDTDKRYGYVEHPELIERVYDIIDICIDLDMYVIVDWHVLTEKNPLTYMDSSKDFFEKIANRYKGSPNIFYEICNEPSSGTQDEIEYANVMIPFIREIDPDSTILVAYYSLDVAEPLDYSNIMYVPHFYMFNGDTANTFLEYIYRGMPIFSTEFGVTTSTEWSQDEPLDSIVFLNGYSKKLLYMMQKLNISWTNWAFSPGYGYAIVQRNMWNNTLDEDILNETGIYMKGVFNGTEDFSDVGNYAEMIPPKEGVAFWNDEYRNNITKVVFENSIDMDRINDSIIYWDVTSPLSEKKVYAYIELDPLDESKYHLYIAGDGEVSIFFSTKKMFSNFIEVKEIDLTHFYTFGVNDMSYMFDSCKKLETIIFGDGFDTSNVNITMYMFRYCLELKNVDFSLFNLDVVSNMLGMFNKATSLETIDLSNVSNKRIKSVSNLFNGCSKLQEIDLSSFNFKNITSYNNMFDDLRNGGVFKIYVKGQTEKEFVEELLDTEDITNGTVLIKGQTEPESFAEAFRNSEYDWSDVHQVAKYISSQFGLGASKINKTVSRVEFEYDDKNYFLEVGDIFTITDSRDFTYNVRILGFNTDRLSDESNVDGEYTYEGEYAGISFEFINLLWYEKNPNDMWSIRQMNDTNSNVGGWGNTTMREYLNGEEGYGSLSNKDYIKTVKKEYNLGNQETLNSSIPADDKLWLLASSEIYDSRFENNTLMWGYSLSIESSMTEGIDETRYSFYSINQPKYGWEIDILKRLKTNETTPSRGWWLRSPNYSSAAKYNYIIKEGKVSTGGYNATSDVGIAPGFCI